MARRVKTPRKSETYRGARRNAALRPTDANEPKGVWPGVKAKYVPYVIKPPIIQFNWANLLLVPPKSPLVKFRERKQPKKYPYSSKRQNERNARKLRSAS